MKIGIIGADYIERSAQTLNNKGILITTPSWRNEKYLKKAKKLGIDAHFYSVESDDQDMESIAQLLAKGAIKTHISHAYLFDEMEKAHQQIASGRTMGKVVVTV